VPPNRVCHSPRLRSLNPGPRGAAATRNEARRSGPVATPWRRG
jgi:hypothetical protein